MVQPERNENLLYNFINAVIFFVKIIYGIACFAIMTWMCGLFVGSFLQIFWGDIFLQNPYYWVIFTIGLILITVLHSFWDDILRFINKIKESLTICPHGIRGGEISSRCSLCHEAKIEKEREQLEQYKEYERKKELKQRASLLREQELKRLVQIQLSKLDYLLHLSPQEFEDVIAEMYRQLGYEVEQTPYTNDEGKDAIAKKDGKIYVIECKRYDKDKTVGRPHLQKFCAAMQDEGAIKGFFVTTAKFTSTAIEYARKKDIELIDGDGLIMLMQQVYPSRNEQEEVKVMCTECGNVLTFNLLNNEVQKPCVCGRTVRNDTGLATISSRALFNDKVCKFCGRRMKVIQGRRGKFWGCTGYPSCRYTENYK